MKLFVFGLGYSARAITEAVAAPGTTISATTRSTDKAAALADTGIAPHIFSGTAPGETLAADLARADTLLVSIAPTDAGDPTLLHHGDAIAAAPNLTWMCYLSTIGVYGNADGAWVDESVPGSPSSRRARNRLAAEAAWQRLAEARGIPLMIARLAGIYGPGRSNFDKLRAGTARRILKPGQVFNRIHTADIGRIVSMAAERRLSGVFNVCDDEPAPPQEVMAHAADLLGVDRPPEVAFAQAEMSPMARAFYADNKRVSNQRIKNALGIEMLHPSYREGLAAVLRAEHADRAED